MTNSRRILTTVAVAVSAAFSASLESLHACKPLTPPPPVLCVNSVSIVKAMPLTFITPITPTTIFVPVFVSTSAGAAPGGVCPTPSTVIGGAVTVTLTGPGGPFVGVAPVLPAGSGFVTQIVSVPVLIPPGTVGLFLIGGAASVGFTANSTGPATMLTAVGDTKVCFSPESAPGSGVPAIEMELLTLPFQICPGGQQANHRYRVTNNTAFTANLVATATSGQNGRIPDSDQGSCVRPGFDINTCAGLPSDPECCSITSFSSPVEADHFPIGFLEDLPNGEVPLSSDPLTFVQPPIPKNISLAPGESRVITIAMRSYHACLDGSCAENVLSMEGTLNDGNDSEVIACAGAALIVNSSVGHIPAVSDWGVVLMTLLVITAATVVILRRRASSDGVPS